MWGSGGHPTALIELELRGKGEGVARSETKPIVPRFKTWANYWHMRSGQRPQITIWSCVNNLWTKNARAMTGTPSSFSGQDLSKHLLATSKGQGQISTSGHPVLRWSCDQRRSLCIPIDKFWWVNIMRSSASFYHFWKKFKQKTAFNHMRLEWPWKRPRCKLRLEHYHLS